MLLVTDFVFSVSRLNCVKCCASFAVNKSQVVAKNVAKIRLLKLL